MGKTVERIQLIVGAIFLSVFFIGVLVQIFTRYLGISVIWTEEFSNYAFIWSIFMGAAVMLAQKKHFAFALLKEKLSDKKKVYLEIFNDSLLFLLSLLFLYYGVLLVTRFWSYRWSTIPQFRMGLVWMCLPVMAATMSYYKMLHIAQDVSDLRRNKEGN